MSAETRRLADRAAALVSSAVILLTLLVSSVFPGSVLTNAVRTLEPASAEFIIPSATEKPDRSVFIRIADVDGDVSPENVIKLINISGISDPVELSGDEPTVLIYHTHDTEAYRQTEDSTYVPTGDFRTDDNGKNVYAVGEELKRILREDYGIIAVHASEKHEKPRLAEAYSRSLETMLRYKELYPTIEMFIDIHRDGVEGEGYKNDFVTVDGRECARMMFVVGTGSSGKSSQNAPEPSTEAELMTPDFESNYALAAELTNMLRSYDADFMRNIRVKAGKYNQQVSSACLLVEVGHNGNTLEQAKNSMIYLAKAIAAVCGK
ncbi:MAG: stage II sporulation protein P [Clostridia bacterium]|nr:stage II sporulation protein P [Clostridia bacterium]